MRRLFENKLSELGFTYIINSGGYYILRKTNEVEGTFKVQLICSESVDAAKYGSHNNNEVESIGLYRFKLNAKTNDTDFIIFGIPNTVNQTHEYIIIPVKELILKLSKKNSTRNGNFAYEIVFWLMPDGFIYNCTDIGLEGEWYFMSKGVNGRLADQTEWNYTKFLNAWETLRRILSSSDQG